MSEVAVNLEPVESPCISICRLDDNNVCVGCFRTATEIGQWLSYSAEQRSDIMKQLPERAGSCFE